MSADERIDTASNDSMDASDPPSISLDHDGGLVPSSGYTEPSGAVSDQRLRATFATLREAEMAIEHLVKGLGIDRSVITSESQTAHNRPGSTGTGTRATPGNGATLESKGPIVVAVAVNDEAQRAKISRLFADFERPSGQESAES